MECHQLPATIPGAEADDHLLPHLCEFWLFLTWAEITSQNPDDIGAAVSTAQELTIGSRIAGCQKTLTTTLLGWRYVGSPARQKCHHETKFIRQGHQSVYVPKEGLTRPPWVVPHKWLPSIVVIAKNQIPQ